MQIEDKGLLSFALDTKIERDTRGGILKISQQTYTQNLLKDFLPSDAPPRETPAIVGEILEDDLPKTEAEKKEVEQMPVRNVIGRLWWLALISRPDIQCALHRCAVWQNKPSRKLWKFLMHILQYLKHTQNFGLIYVRPAGDENLLEVRRSVRHRVWIKKPVFLFLFGGIIFLEHKTLYTPCFFIN